MVSFNIPLNRLHLEFEKIHLHQSNIHMFLTNTFSEQSNVAFEKECAEKTDRDHLSQSPTHPYGGSRRHGGIRETAPTVFTTTISLSELGPTENASILSLKPGSGRWVVQRPADADQQVEGGATHPVPPKTRGVRAHRVGRGQPWGGR